jgi:hypothetical protein
MGTGLGGSTDGEGLAALREVLGLQWDLVVTFGSVPSD